MPDRNIRPKDRFQASKEALATHVQIMSSAAARASLDVALLQYIHALSGQKYLEIQPSSANYHKMCGAQEFITVLLNLGESPELQQREVVGTLKH